MTAAYDPFIAMENSVIGGLLVDSSRLSQLDTLEPGHFMQWQAQVVFSAMRNLEAASEPIDLRTVEDQLRKQGVSEEAVSVVYLGECVHCYPTLDNLIEYAKRVQDAALARRVRSALANVLEAGATGELDGQELLSLAHETIGRFEGAIPSGAVDISTLIRRRVKQLEKIAQDRAAGVRSMTGYPTGVAALDELLGGWQAQIVSIVAARPGMGKSSLALATADECSAAGFGVHLFNLEDTESAYADRTLARASEVPAEAMRNASMSNEQFGALARAWPRLGKRKWLIDSNAGISAGEIVRRARKHRKDNDTRVVLVDYVQLVRGNPSLKRHEQLADIITILADAAKADDVAYVVMSQLNRSLESRQDKRPQLSDLRESGALEERAKCVVGVYRGSYYNDTAIEGIDYPEDGQKPDQFDFQRQAQLIVLKNSNGRTGPVMASFCGPTTRMS